MQLKTVVIVAAGLTAASLAGCGHDHQTAVTPSPPTSDVQTLDTSGVLALAQKSSETGTPFAVDGGLLVLSDSSDTAEAISVNGM
jgi:hypothetical protein